MIKRYLFLFLFLGLCILPANSTQQYIQKMHEQKKQQTQKKVVPTRTEKIIMENKNVAVNLDYDKYYNEALKQIDDKNLYAAHTSLCKALEIKHDFVKAIKQRGFVRNSLADYNGAILDFNNAISLTPNDAALFYGRGYAKVALQNYPSAVDDFNRAIELNSNDEDFYHQRGYAYSLWGKSTNTEMYFIKAQLDFNKVLSMNPNNTEAHLYRGMVFCERGKKEQGLAEIEYAMNNFKQKGDEDAYQRSVQIYNWIKRDY